MQRKTQSPETIQSLMRPSANTARSCQDQSGNSNAKACFSRKFDLFLIPLHCFKNIVFDNVTAQNHADWVAGCEILRHAKRIGNSTFSFLVGLI
jgi:hypothetical protein